ncbi:hypothetical protein NP233_g9707 [Leucocoprinus birnbaumii]|uniref:Uncharacterized protein n=1 Tax=Leucocoprinus birnbaumii TaxID=56174 RepID=A0AAD5VKL9_9AGAR|nr:hypothetical protein NP233_g9707 [Leucocoprinus birnbaumii]
MQNELPYEYTLESISSPTLFRSTYIAPTIDAAGGMYAAHHLTRCPGPNATSPTMGNIKRRSPDTVLPLDAPTQPRRYVTPSVTSRKDIPSFYTQNVALPFLPKAKKMNLKRSELVSLLRIKRRLRGGVGRTLLRLGRAG